MGLVFLRFATRFLWHFCHGLNGLFDHMTVTDNKYMCWAQSSTAQSNSRIMKKTFLLMSSAKDVMARCPQVTCPFNRSPNRVSRLWSHRAVCVSRVCVPRMTLCWSVMDGNEPVEPEALGGRWKQQGGRRWKRLLSSHHHIWKNLKTF